MEAVERIGADAVVDVKLPARAEILLGILKQRQGRNEAGFPSQKDLMSDLGVRERQVVRLLALLKDAGMIVIERITAEAWAELFPDRPRVRASVNFYRVTDAGFEWLDKTKMAGRQKSPPAKNGVCHPPKMACATRQKSLPAEAAPLDGINSGKQQQESAAAASAKCPEETIAQLTELGLPEKHRSLADDEPELAKAIIAHARHRFSQRKPVRNQAGYLIACFRDPGNFGFTQNGDKWSPPRGEARAGPIDPERRQRAAEAAYARWRGLSADDQEKVYQRTIRAWNFLQYQEKAGYNVVSHCVKMMQQMEEEGRL